MKIVPTSSSPKTILVTGGAGLVGNFLCERLLNDGHTVVCLDNFYTGTLSNLQRLRSNPRFSIITHDVINPYDVKIDEIYHCACPAAPIHYQRDPVQTIKTSVMGTINMLDLARKHNARILLTSTSEIYGDPLVHPQPETYWGNVNPIGIRSCYDEGKRCAETLMFDYHRQYGTRIRVARIFNTYGPYMHQEDGRVVSNFILQALRGQNITVYGSGEQTRSFCFVSDLVDGLVRLMEHPDDSMTGPINLGNPSEFTMLELAQKVINLTGSASEIVHLPLPADDPRQRRPDITRAMTILGWKPRIELDVGLTETIQYFQNELNSATLVLEG